MEKINIGGVPETMIQTLYARAKESKKQNRKIYDEKAIEIVSAMDYTNPSLNYGIQPPQKPYM
ncbi:MAG: hypothetical protein NC078_07040, partial [Ruminococcus sp.]|nr:hypothetical protein [Ruminococcus sp.]